MTDVSATVDRLLATEPGSADANRVVAEIAAAGMRAEAKRDLQARVKARRYDKAQLLPVLHHLLAVAR